MSIMPPGSESNNDAPPRCESAYNASRGLWLHCTGDHLRGNIFRGDVHQQRYAGIVWTWYDDEAHVTRDVDAR